MQDLFGAIRASSAVKVYVCNIVTQTGETDLFSCSDHVRVLEEHVGDRLFDVVLCNDNFAGTLNEGDRWVNLDENSLADSRLRTANLTDDRAPWRHDSVKLASTLIDILEDRTGPLD